MAVSFCMEERSLVLDTRRVEGNINPKPVFGMPVPWGGKHDYKNLNGLLDENFFECHLGMENTWKWAGLWFGPYSFYIVLPITLEA